MSILKQKYCCEVMERILKRGDSALKYRDFTRSYYIEEIIHYGKKISVGAANEITYCPWCSSRLPKSLYDELNEILAKEYNLHPDIWNTEKESLIPEEFFTDEWWKKRDL